MHSRSSFLIVRSLLSFFPGPFPTLNNAPLPPLGVLVHNPISLSIGMDLGRFMYVIMDPVGRCPPGTCPQQGFSFSLRLRVEPFLAHSIICFMNTSVPIFLYNTSGSRRDLIRVEHMLLGRRASLPNQFWKPAIPGHTRTYPATHCNPPTAVPEQGGRQGPWR